jgi:MtN3 and saliva related transmembrane protein
MDLNELIGVLAGVLTTIAYVPQVVRTWTSGTARDISLTMLLMLISGVALWILYAFHKGATSLLFANLFTLVLTSLILIVKLRRG